MRTMNDGAATSVPGASPPAESHNPADEPMPDRSGHGEIHVRIFGRTDVGQVREHNEDNFLVADLTRGTRGLLEADPTQLIGERGALFGVYDGMGGAAAGEIASHLAADVIHQKLSQAGPPEDAGELAERLVEAIEAAGQHIFNEGQRNRARRGMGTTCTTSLLMDQHLLVGQIGDSRAYILRGERLVQVTRDQSLVTQLIEAGQLTEEEARTFEHQNIILQALGTSDTVHVDLTHVELRRDDILMLCSDGLSGVLRNEEVREILRTIDDPRECCDVLTARANQAGGHDNITVVVAKFEGAGLDCASTHDIEHLRYEKYRFPDPAPEPAQPRGAAILEAAKPALPASQGGGERTDQEDEPDGPLPAGDPSQDDEPIQIPVDAAPLWLLLMMIVSALACMVVVGCVYLVR